MSEEKCPVYDGDELALRGLCNRDGIILPSRQSEVWASVGRVLDTVDDLRRQLAAKDKQIATLRKTGQELCDCLNDVGQGKGGWAWEEVLCGGLEVIADTEKKT